MLNVNANSATKKDFMDQFLIGKREDQNYNNMRVQYLVAYKDKNNEFAFNFTPLMPLYRIPAKSTVPSSAYHLNCLSRFSHKLTFKLNSLYQLIVYNLDFEQHLSISTLAHDVDIFLSSTLKFCDIDVQGKAVCAMSNKECEKTIKTKIFATYTDMQGQNHNIYLPFLLSRCQYFATLYYVHKTNLIINRKNLNFDPKHIALETSCKSVPQNFKDKQQLKDYRFSAKALEAAMLFCNCTNNNSAYDGCPREYIGACIFLQSDYALLNLLHYHFNFKQWTRCTISIANNFGVEHPLFEYLVLYGSTNFLGLSFVHLLRIVTSSSDSCHYLCKQYNDRETAATCENEFKTCTLLFKCYGSQSDGNGGMIWQKPLDNYCRARSSKKVQKHDHYYNKSTLFILQTFRTQIQVCQELFGSICIICESWVSHNAQHGGDVSWATLRCCQVRVHRICYHALFQQNNVWLCPSCEYCYHYEGKFISEFKARHFQGNSYKRQRSSYYIGFDHTLQVNLVREKLVCDQPKVDVSHMIEAETNYLTC